MTEGWQSWRCLFGRGATWRRLPLGFFGGAVLDFAGEGEGEEAEAEEGGGGCGVGDVGGRGGSRI